MLSELKPCVTVIMSAVVFGLAAVPVFTLLVIELVVFDNDGDSAIEPRIIEGNEE